MPNSRHTRREKQTRTTSTQKPKNEQEMPILLTQAYQKHSGANAHTPSQQKPFGTILVECRTDHDAARESKECVHAEDPAYDAGGIGGKLVRDDVRLEGAQRVHRSQGGEHGAPGAEDDEPGAEATLGVCVLILGERGECARAVGRDT